MVIIALCGLKRVGKDTVADYLVESRGFRHVKFTEPLKDGLCAFFGFTREQIEGPDKDVVDRTWGVTPRRVMQWMGTDVMQFKVAELLPDVGRKFWAMQLVNKIRALLAPKHAEDRCDRVVVSDLRFRHEHECLKQAFGADLVTVRIVRPALGTVDEHLSELEVDSIVPDFIIENVGTAAEFLAAWRRLPDAITRDTMRQTFANA